jgi:hypothetical protein
VVTLAMAVALIWLWRTPVRFAWQAAALAIAVVAAAPFSLDYDMTILAVAIAFLAADGFERGFIAWEKTTLAALWLVPIAARSIAGAIYLPIGVITMLAAFAFIVRQAPRDGAGQAAADTLAESAGGDRSVW